MIHFRKVRFKNFLSTGDKFTEVVLDSAETTLIIGTNGAGKSTMLDAISFALFGKAHRAINKPLLVNSINNKNCVVEIEFEIGKSKFMVRRGLKPNIFEVYQNGRMLNQESHAKDYQKQLEQNILKLNHKSFHQIVVLGSSSFIPFMQLPLQHRREVIEDLLDINIFSKMNMLLKEESAKIKQNLKDVTYQIDLAKEKIEVQQKYINDLKSLSEDQKNKRLAEISQLEQEILKLEEESAVLAGELTDDDLGGQLDAQNSKRDKLLSFLSNIKQNAKKVSTEAQFYSENDVCPTCNQSIDEDLKKQKVHSCKEKAKELSTGINELKANIKSVEDNIAGINTELKRISELSQKIKDNTLVISSTRKQISKLYKDNENSDVGDIQSAIDKLNEIKVDKETLTELKLKLLDDRSYNEAMSEMLKDTGIKTKIIKQYLPVMNKMINQYLQMLDFFVAFELDESFEETIKSRHRDIFKYSSFSEGEKTKIDVALLFTWRQIAKMKNSASTNLLVMDETFDASLDTDGIENLMKILNTFDATTNVFVISHKAELDGKFKQTFKFTRENNFSKYEII